MVGSASAAARSCASPDPAGRRCRSFRTSGAGGAGGDGLPGADVIGVADADAADLVAHGSDAFSEREYCC